MLYGVYGLLNWWLFPDPLTVTYVKNASGGSSGGGVRIASHVTPVHGLNVIQSCLAMFAYQQSQAED